MPSAKPCEPGRLAWPTLLVAALIYGGWFCATLWHVAIPDPLLPVVGGWLIAWHGSLQHETIHGHPTRHDALNRAIGWPPLSLWLPYEIYHRTHTLHHATEHLTDPDHDPESRYLARSSVLNSVIAHAQSTLLGRLVLGPFIEVGRFLSAELLAVLRNDGGRRRLWGMHVLGVAAIIFWLVAVCRMSMTTYLLCFVYPGIALSLLRSFVEHRADASMERRIAVVERAPILGILYLNNNLHAAHHANPGAPWWRLPRLYRDQRPRLVAEGTPIYRGYGEVVKRYILRPHDTVIHPYARPAKIDEVR